MLLLIQATVNADRSVAVAVQASGEGVRQWAMGMSKYMPINLPTHPISSYRRLYNSFFFLQILLQQQNLLQQHLLQGAAEGKNHEVRNKFCHYLLLFMTEFTGRHSEITESFYETLPCLPLSHYYHDYG